MWSQRSWEVRACWVFREAERTSPAAQFLLNRLLCPKRREVMRQLYVWTWCCVSFSVHVLLSLGMLCACSAYIQAVGFKSPPCVALAGAGIGCGCMCFLCTFWCLLCWAEAGAEGCFGPSVCWQANFFSHSNTCAVTVGSPWKRFGKIKPFSHLIAWQVMSMLC